MYNFLLLCHIFCQSEIANEVEHRGARERDRNTNTVGEGGDPLSYCIANIKNRARPRTHAPAIVSLLSKKIMHLLQLID